MIDLAVNNTGEFIRLKDISSRQNITIKYLEQIMPLLTRAGLVSSLRGNSGGYRLSRLPEEYTAGEILRAAEGSLAPIPCLEDQPNLCPRSEYCPSLPFWSGLNQAINDYVDSKTLADLLPHEYYASGI